MTHEAQLIENEAIGEQLSRLALPSGLTVVVFPRPGFKKTFATFATHYGSIDNAFRDPKTGQVVEVPDGIAHFLEHKMFEKKGGGDAFDDFARLGASSNAYTDYTSTTFLFQTTSHVLDNLGILLDFVQEPYFTDANVEKEKGIIEQEIRMYLDMPGDRLHSNLMKALYVNHPVRIDIAGTVESIRTITPEDLYTCYRTFYHPSNMVLLVIGDIDPQRVFDYTWENQKAKAYGNQSPITRIYPDEPHRVNEKHREQEMVVSMPLFVMGYKDTQTGLVGRELLRHEITYGLMWQMLCGKSSPLFQHLYQQGLINDRFYARYGASTTFGFSTVGGETPDPKALEAQLVDGLQQAPLREEDLARAKKRELGEFIALFQNPEELAYAFNHLFFRQIDIFDYVDTILSIGLDDIEQARQVHLQESERASSVIKPISS
ncbi:EF-P 5-aminopentanol modification-associated protein YfmH [Sulfobacillus thermosulfidooxidans]|uniref:EF-P 5-aminopentanol modification-associated protein YfmH n=1 Tax=Sulfobacillus thermosulfidooxidans TaxID=28034 RepID=UPI0004292D34|nr:pitrilysin family protein [Sulfobacillus thermosulfidooxidans]